MNNRFIAAAAGLILAGVSLPALAVDGDIEAGERKAATCVACHGAQGNSNNPAWPSLAGQPADYIVYQLQLFRDGDRQDPLMTPQAAGLSDEDIRDLAVYYEAQEAVFHEADEELVERGREIYRAGIPGQGVAACMACHGPAGEGVKGAQYPRVAGQHAQYMRKALREYRDEERDSDPNRMMRDIASRMSDEDIEAVTEYMTGLHR
ncbi:c-type cytochrome [Alkalilimnicola ehrlichii MLHE-1]|uniref:Cytochrome c, class I n=1 Tax=Alkalilimnicola ehrlichii (strain ATCC BAA-1101 / DSM 17681 / MLHE-1) TaxID=187272 RepID=Q0A4P4_ALKEH|nr:c-type cytochrome [Alkalilimnicola ehrlichii]ABI58193.1 cytochrome c, class I [Alkalilimnicola ehrlichii MLHE-1]